MSSYALPSIAAPVTTNFTVFTISGIDLTPSERACVLSSYLSSLSGSFSSQEAAIALVMNLMVTALPALANELTHATSVGVVNHSIPAIQYLKQMGVEDPNSEFKPVDGFPTLPKTPSNAANANSNVRNAYAGTSMVLFSIGKEFTSDNEKGAKDNRPKALKGQFGIPDDVFTSSPGKPDGPSIAALGQIYSAFSVYTELRALIMKTFLAIYRGSSHQSVEMGLMMVSIQLLDGAQLTHVSAIQDMLEAHPWLLKVPALRPSVKEYAQELKRYSLIPQGVRGYIRLIESNQNLYFPASKMKPLVAVAVALKSDIEESMKTYAGGKNQYKELVEEVRRYQDGFRMQVGADTLSSALSMPDVELPAIKEAVVLTPTTQ